MNSTYIEKFKINIKKSGILDPEGIHHEFVSGMHGRKLDFDAIPDDSDLFNEWVDVVVKFIKETYQDIDHARLAIVSVANGTNRLVPLVANKLGGGSVALLTEKVSPKEVKLTDEAVKKLKSFAHDLVVTIEDVGTKGTTSATALRSAMAAGAKRVESINTWQRRHRLEEIESLGVVNHSIITDLLPTLTPEDCRKSEYCAKGWQYIEHA
ncbi:MAG TPA: phosphoribosyltransferase [Candidatus Saccharimonadales bacterium]|nr:phosphoribosyltransferase [Candidatus Saccharimonadales bacterium]